MVPARRVAGGVASHRRRRLRGLRQGVRAHHRHAAPDRARHGRELPGGDPRHDRPRDRAPDGRVAPPISAAVGSGHRGAAAVGRGARSCAPPVACRGRGRSSRPWPCRTSRWPLRAPRLVLGALLHGFAGLGAGSLAASLAMAYCLQGLAVIHVLTRGVAGRIGILGAVYVTFVMLPGWPALLYAAAGRGRRSWASGPARLARPARPRSHFHLIPHLIPKLKGDTHGSHPARTRRQARPDGRSRPRQGRLRPQLPAAPRQGAARHRRQQGAFETQRAQLEARNLELRPRPRPSATSSTARASSSSARPARWASSTAPSSARDLAEILTAGGFSVGTQQIALNTPIKAIGLHKVPVHLHPEVEVTVTINVARSPRKPSARRAARAFCRAARRTTSTTSAWKSAPRWRSPARTCEPRLTPPGSSAQPATARR